MKISPGIILFGLCFWLAPLAVADQTIELAITDTTTSANPKTFFYKGDDGKFTATPKCDGKDVTGKFKTGVGAASYTWSPTTGLGLQSPTPLNSQTVIGFTTTGDYSVTVSVSGTLMDGTRFSATSEVKNLKIIELTLHTVTFGAASPATSNGGSNGKFDILYDGTDTKYTGTDWTKGNAATAQNPISYKQSAHPSVTAKFNVDPTNFTDSVHVRGKSEFSAGFKLKYSDKSVPFSPSTPDPGPGIYPMTSTQSTTAGELPGTIRFFDKAFPTKWEASADGTNWHDLQDQSANTMYVTLHTPTANKLYRTLLYLGCKKADGDTADTTAVNHIWGALTGLKVSRWNDPPDFGGMTYYANGPNNTCFTLAQLLTGGDGRCSAWALFLRETLRAQGITGVDAVGIVPEDHPPGHKTVKEGNKKIGFIMDSIWVKELDFTGIANMKLVPHDDANTPSIPTNSGIPAQGTPSPTVRRFSNHGIVRYGGNLYDPSYGQKYVPPLELTDWQRFSLQAVSWFSNESIQRWWYDQNTVQTWQRAVKYGGTAPP